MKTFLYQEMFGNRLEIFILNRDAEEASSWSLKKKKKKCTFSIEYL